MGACLAAFAPSATSQTADEFLRRAATLQGQGNAQGAVTALREAVARHPQRPDLLVQLSVTYLRIGRPGQAVETLRKAKLLAPEHPGVAYFLGLAYVQADRHVEARAELEFLLGQQPANTQALHLYGVCLLKMGELEQGIRALERVARADPGLREALYTLGSAYVRAGQVEQAADLVNTRLDGDESPGALLIRGSVYLAQRRYGEALALLERARDARSGLPMVHSQIGVALLYEGRRERAERAFRAELEINPLDFNANAFLGWLLQQSGQPGEALELLRDAHGLRESDIGVKYLLAQSHSAMREWSEASALLEDVTRAQPDFIPAHVMLARAYAKLKRTEKFRTQREIIARLNEERQQRDLRGVDHLYDGTVLSLPRQ